MKRSAWRYLWQSEDIRKKLLMTLLLLVIYRLAANIPVPGIDRSLIANLATSSNPAADRKSGRIAAICDSSLQ